MPTAHGNGIDIEYVTSGDPADPALLLVMGLGAQLIAWPEAFVEQLTARGFFTIRYDNRDSGLSTKFEGTPDFAGALRRRRELGALHGRGHGRRRHRRCSTTSA